MPQCNTCGGAATVLRFRKGPKRSTTTYSCDDCGHVWHSHNEQESTVVAENTLGAKVWEQRARDALAVATKFHKRAQRLEWALRFYADERRYHGPNQRAAWFKGDEYGPDSAGYFKDVTRDGGHIARTILQEGDE